MRGEELETSNSSNDGARKLGCEAKLLRELNDSLHSMSQPMTVLLCTLDCGMGSESWAEMKEAVVISQEACERLRKTVVTMQMQVQEAIGEGRRGDCVRVSTDWRE